MAFSRGITFTGLKAVERAIKRIDSRVYLANREAGTALANKVLERAKQLTPLETGQLKASGRIDYGAVSAKGAIVQLVITFSAFRGPFDYAEIQHENEYYHHDIGQANYLGQAVDEMLARGTAELAQLLYKRLFR
jgi:hypothetical protein